MPRPGFLVALLGTLLALLLSLPVLAQYTGGTEQFKDTSRATPDNPEGLNIIPSSRWNPFAWAVINAASLPNLPDDYLLGNRFIRQPYRISGNEAGLRVDHTFSTKDTIFFPYRWSDSYLNTADPLARPDGPVPGIGLDVGDDSRGIVQGECALPSSYSGASGPARSRGSDYW